MKNKVLSLLFIMGLGYGSANAQLTLQSPEMISAKELCVNSAIDHLKKIGLTLQETYLLQKDYSSSCLLDTWQYENIVSKISFDKINKEHKDKIIKLSPELTANSILILSTDLFNSVQSKIIKKEISDEERMIARDISYVLKKRILDINIPPGMMKFPVNKRDWIVQPYLDNFKKAKIVFQNLDSVLYDYRQSIKVITLIEKAKTKEEKSRLNFNKEGCEISQTYMNNQIVDSCKSL